MTARLLALLLALATWPALAHPEHPVCKGHDFLIGYLEKQWREARLIVLRDMDGNAEELLINPQTGTWSHLVTERDGPTCIHGYGNAHVILAPPGDLWQPPLEETPR